MRRLPMTRICWIVCGGPWASAVPAQTASASTSRKRPTREVMHGTRLGVRVVREMEVCLIFTGLGPCGEHKCWCGPCIGFTGRICTPSLLKNLVLPQGKNDYI